MSKQVKVTKFGIHKSIPSSQLGKYKKSGWKEIPVHDWKSRYKERTEKKEREEDGD